LKTFKLKQGLSKILRLEQATIPTQVQARIQGIGLARLQRISRLLLTTADHKIQIIKGLQLRQSGQEIADNLRHQVGKNREINGDILGEDK
jgi:hypothetical protein